MTVGSEIYLPTEMYRLAHDARFFEFHLEHPFT